MRKEIEKTIILIKARINRDMKIIKSEKDYYKPVRAGNFRNNSYIEYESNGDKHKALSIKECLNQIKPYLKNIINNLKKSDTWKTQLTIPINFIVFKDHDEKRVIHSNSDDHSFLYIELDGKHQ